MRLPGRGSVNRLGCPADVARGPARGPCRGAPRRCRFGRGRVLIGSVQRHGPFQVQEARWASITGDLRLDEPGDRPGLRGDRAQDPADLGGITPRAGGGGDRALARSSPARPRQAIRVPARRPSPRSRRAVSGTCAWRGRGSRRGETFCKLLQVPKNNAIPLDEQVAMTASAALECPPDAIICRSVELPSRNA